MRMKDESMFDLTDTITATKEEIVAVDVTPDYSTDRGLLLALILVVKKGKPAANEYAEVEAEEVITYRCSVENNMLTYEGNAISQTFGIDKKFDNLKFYQA